MKKNAEQYKQKLCTLYSGAKLLGWAFVGFFPVAVGVRIWSHFALPRWSHEISTDLISNTIAFLFGGLAIMGTVELLRSLTVEERPPSPLLRNIHYVLYAMAFLLLLGIAIRVQTRMSLIATTYEGRELSTQVYCYYILHLLLEILPNLAGMLLACGAGLSVRLMLPIIEENKTLV